MTIYSACIENVVKLIQLGTTITKKVALMWKLREGWAVGKLPAVPCAILCLTVCCS